MTPAAEKIAHLLRTRTAALVEKIVDEHYRRNPEMAKRYGERGRLKCLQDGRHHLDFLANAVQVASNKGFIDYCIWCRGVLSANKVPASDFLMHLHVMRDILQQELPDAGQHTTSPINAGIAAISEPAPATQQV